MTRYHAKNKDKTVEETLFNTQMAGKIHEIRERSISVQIMSDGECFLIVPKGRVPLIAQVEGTDVIVYFTTKYGHFGVVKAHQTT